MAQLATGALAALQPRRVAVFRAMGVGDLLCAVPALRALRAALPEAEITLVGLPWAREFVRRFSHLLDGFLEFPGFPGLPEQEPRLAELPAFLEQAQRHRFDLAIQLHGSGGLSNPVTALLGARRTAGFYEPGQYCPDPKLFAPYPDGRPEIHIWLELMRFLGAPRRDALLEFPISAEEHERAKALLGSDAPYVCVHPGASAPARRWQPDRFAAVADGLASRGWRVVLTGSGPEAALTAAVGQAMRAPALDLAGRTGLGELGALVAGASLVVCNDTGISHIAVALDVPSVVVVLASDPRRWAPLDRERHVVVRHPVDCSPCGQMICPIDHRCSLGIQAHEVEKRARQLLPTAASHAH